MRINWYLSDPDDDYAYAVWNLNSIIEKSKKKNKSKYSMQKKKTMFAYFEKPCDWDNTGLFAVDFMGISII